MAENKFNNSIITIGLLTKLYITLCETDHYYHFSNESNSIDNMNAIIDALIGLKPNLSKECMMIIKNIKVINNFAYNIHKLKSEQSLKVLSDMIIHQISEYINNANYLDIIKHEIGVISNFSPNIFSE